MYINIIACTCDKCAMHVHMMQQHMYNTFLPELELLKNDVKHHSVLSCWRTRFFSS